MPVLKYDPFPTVAPDLNAGNTYQRIQASPEAFGAGVGAGMRSFAGQLEQAGDKLASVAVAKQNLLNQIASDDAVNQWQDLTNKVLYGDPNVPDDTGFYGKKGKEAMTLFPQVRKQLDDLRMQARGVMQNPVQQHLFDQATRRMQGMLFSEIGRHYDKEFDNYALHTAQAGLKNALFGASVAANNENFSAFQEELGKITLKATEIAKRQGLDEEGAKQIRQQYGAQAARQWADTLGRKDPQAAISFVEQHKELLGPEYENVLQGFRAKALDAEASAIANGLPSPSRGKSGLVRGGALSAAEIKQYALDAGFKGEAADIITAISFPESGGNPNAHNPKYPDDSYGLTQINALAHGPKAKEALGNPKRAMELAYEVSNGGTNFRPWTTYTSGEYRQYLPQAKAAAPGRSSSVDKLAAPEREPGELPDDQVPGLQGRLEAIKKDPRVQNDPQLYTMAVKKARAEFNGQYADAQHRLRLQHQMQKAQDEQLQDGLIKRMTSDSPNYPTTDEVMKSPMSPEAKRTMIGFIERQTKPDPVSRVSAVTQQELYSRIHAADDDPNKLFDKQAIRQAYISGQLTWAARGQLEEDFDKLYGEREKDISKAQADLLKRIEVKIWPALAFGRDKAQLIEQAKPTGGPENVIKWKQAVDDKIREYQKTNKNPRDLFIVGKPDYVGSDDFLKSLGVQGNINAIVQPDAPAPAPNTTDLTTQDGVMKAYNAKQITYREAREALIKLGVPTATPTAPPLAR